MEGRNNDGIDIPCYFLCPISMQLMQDPVTVSSGVTYDRRSIHKWLRSSRTAICPVTKHPILEELITPNHNLRRLIQSWCSTDGTQMEDLLRRDSETNAAGVIEFLLSIVTKTDDAVSRDEALNILEEFEISDSDLKIFVSLSDGDDQTISNSLIEAIGSENPQIRCVAIRLLKSAYCVADPTHLIGFKSELFTRTVRILSDRISLGATKAALKLMIKICPWGRNRIKAANSGAVAALVELLLDGSCDRRTSELALTSLDQLCGCAEGRAELLRHAAGIAVVSKWILRVSAAASDRAVRILRSISRHTAGDRRVLEEMAEVGVAAKLCLVVQVEGGGRSKERAEEILRRHFRVWKDSSCIPAHLAAVYPSPSC